MTIQRMTNEAYHAHPALGRSGAWTLYKKTPAHFRYGEKPTTKAQAFGQAVHDAILEPHTFEAKYLPGVVDKRTKQGQAFLEIAASQGKVPVKEEAYLEALRIRDAVYRNSLAHRLLQGAMIEQAGFAKDEEYGVELKCKPDIYNPGMKLLADLKSAANAGSWEFGRAAAQFGYHLQEPWYTKVWKDAGGGDVHGFCFIVVEKEAPYLVAVHEMDPEDFEEGMAVMRKTMRLYAECLQADQWPGFPETVQRVTLPNWARIETGQFAGEEV